MTSNQPTFHVLADSEGADESARSPESALARAVFGQAVVDLYDKNDRVAGDARAWLYSDDDEEEEPEWRERLAELADINLEALQDATDDADHAFLRKIAQHLDREVT